MPSNVSSELARCLHEKKISFGPGYWICTRDYCSSMKGGTLRRGGCVWPRSYFSINRCSPEKLCSRTFSSRASRCRWERRLSRNRRRKLPSPRVSACKRRRLPIRRTSSAVNLRMAVATALRLSRHLARRVECWKLCAAACTPRSLQFLS